MAFNNTKNFYEILQIETDATSTQIKCAYRKLARKYHPDVNKDPDAIEKFKEITSAYETLSDPQKRKNYDIINGIFKKTKETTSQSTSQTSHQKTSQTSTQTTNNQTSSKKAEEEYRENTSKTNSQTTTPPPPQAQKRTKNETPKQSSHFRWLKLLLAKFKKQKRTRDNYKPQKGENITTEVKITPDEVITGSKRIINILTTQTCPQCFGRRFINGSKCQHCNGKGEVSKRKKITVTIPKGIKHGSKLRLKGEGASGKNGGPNGDLYINIKIDTQTKIHFDKLNIYYNVPITPFEAALGEEIKIPAFDGTIKLKLPPNTCSGQKFRIANQGIKKNGKVGDLIVTVSIEFSHNLSDDEIKLYQKLKNLSTDDVRKNLMNEN